MEIILMILYLVCWALLTGGMYLLNMRTASPYLVLFQLLLMIGYLLLVFLGPQIQSLNDAEEKARKRYEKLEDEIFKQPWLDAISNRNRYYLLFFLPLAFYIFFDAVWHVYSETSANLNGVFRYIDIYLLVMTSIFEGFVSFIYILFSQKEWYFYTIPLTYLAVPPSIYVIMSRYGHTYPAYHVGMIILKNYLLCALLLAWPFFYFAKTSISWSIPFFILIPLLLVP